MTKHSPNAKPKLKRKHPWRSFAEIPPKGSSDTFNHRALPNTYNRPIKL